MKIDNKKQMYEMLKAGWFGNAFRTWPSIKAACDDGYFGPYGLRTSIKGGPGYPGDMQMDRALQVEKEINLLNPEFLAICEEVPNRFITMNCEVSRTPRGLYIRYREGPGHMRQAMENCKHEFGLDAGLRMARHLGYDGFDWICQLLDNYQGINDSESAVVEFATFSVPVGPLQQKYVVWEVRAY